MLVITFHNDGTGTDEAANYDVEVSVTLTPRQLQTLWTGRIENHNRAHGWGSLLRDLADKTT